MTDKRFHGITLTTALHFCFILPKNVLWLVFVGNYGVRITWHSCKKKKKNSGLKPSRLPLQISLELKTNIESNRVKKKEVHCIEPN